MSPEGPYWHPFWTWLWDWIIFLVRSFDPNDKIAPEGVGTNHLVAVTAELPYTIRFENYKTATAPVQELVVVDYLDSDLDWTTVRFGEVGYGDRIVPLPPASLDYTTNDVPPTNSIGIAGITVSNMIVNIRAVFNAQNGRLEWRLKAIDSGTGLAPEDALAGILPPNQTNHCGEGYLTYSVKPKADAPVGTRIDNKASIVFDTNDAIETPHVFNTIGDLSPVIGMRLAYLASDRPLGRRFSYSVTLSNAGMGSATNLVVTNTIPTGCTLVSASATVGTLVIDGNQIIWSFDELVNGEDATLTITVLPEQEGSLAGTIVVGGYGAVTNFTPVVTVGPPLVDIRVTGGAIEIRWPGCATSYTLRSSAILPAAVWNAVTNSPAVSGSDRVVTWTGTNQTMFFLLRRP